MNYRTIVSCQFGEWYPHFRDVAFRSKVIDLPAAFVQYLVDDGVFLAADSNALPRRARPSPDDNYSDWSEDEPEDAAYQDEPTNLPEFPELLAEIQAAIDDLGGCVAPKLNWSAPHDAAWVSSNKSLACRNADEVLLLLKSSDRIAHDICHAFDACADAPAALPGFHLALRKWVPLRPEREFRCFVKGRDLAAISQRNIMENAASLEAQKEDLLEAMLEFFEEHVQQRFPKADYTFDVYITTAGRVRLIDFNPIGGTTSPLLFDWAELPYALPNSADEPDSSSAATSAESPESMTNDTGDRSAEEASPVRQPGEQPSASEGGASSPDRAGGRGPSHAESNGTASGSGITEEGAAGNGWPGEIEFRLNTDGAVMRPSVAAYGAPFDMVDNSDGSAISELLRRLQTEDRG